MELLHYLEIERLEEGCWKKDTHFSLLHLELFISRNFVLLFSKRVI